MTQHMTITVICAFTQLFSGWSAGAEVLQSSAATADNSASAKLTLASDYRFRGISQVDRSPVIQGGLELGEGFYAGVWASNVTFSSAAIEVDIYAGYAGTLTQGINYDIGYMYYAYPEDDASPELDYQEIYASISHSAVTLGFAYSSDYFSQTGDFWYLFGEYELLPVENITLGVHLGWNRFNSAVEFARFFGRTRSEDSSVGYLDWAISASTKYYGLEWSMALVGTDVNRDTCFAGTRLCENTAVFSLTKSL